MSSWLCEIGLDGPVFLTSLGLFPKKLSAAHEPGQVQHSMHRTAKCSTVMYLDIQPYR